MKAAFEVFKSNKGVSMVLFVIGLTLILGVGALVTDVGIVALERQKFQNAIDAATLAAAQELPDKSKALQTANQYIELNGFSTSDVSVNFSDSDKSVSISGNRNIDFFFARVFGFNNTSVSISSSAVQESVGEAFNYVLFSGSQNATLTLNGSNMYIGGSSHTNKNFIANGSKLTITGICEAVTTITVNGSQININTRIPNAPFIEMPDFSETIKLQAQQNGTYYSGNKTYNGSNMDVSSSIYVDGNVTVNGSHFSGKGSIVATGNITFNGSNLNQSSDDAVCFYSKNGNITINGSNAELDGILYAPKGSIIMNGSNQTVNGRVIGNTVTVNGSGLSIIGGSDDLKSLPSHGVKLVK